MSVYDVFFFSSRRRHTRYWRDWSSDVCSSDLGLPDRVRREVVVVHVALGLRQPEIGRAACRERVEISVVAVSLKKKKKAKTSPHINVLRHHMSQNIIVTLHYY